MTRTTRHSTVGRNHFRGRKSNFSITMLKKALRSGYSAMSGTSNLNNQKFKNSKIQKFKNSKEIY